MKIFLGIFFILMSSVCGFGQIAKNDSLRNLLDAAKDDQTRFKYIIMLVRGNLYSDPGTSLQYIQEEIRLASEIGSDSARSVALAYYGILLSQTGDLPQAVYYGFESLKAAERSGQPFSVIVSYYYLSTFYRKARDYHHALDYVLKAKELFESKLDTTIHPTRLTKVFYTVPVFRYLATLLDLASTYNKLDKSDSALKYALLVKDSYLRLFGEINWSSIPFELGNIYLKMGDDSNALKNFRRGIDIAAEEHIIQDIMDNYSGIAAVYQKKNEPDSVIFYANKVIEFGGSHGQYPAAKIDALNMLARAYKSTCKSDSAVKYLESGIAIKDSLFNQSKLIRMQSMSFDEQLRQKEIVDQRAHFQSEIKMYALIAGLVFVSLISFLLYRNNIQKQKAYAELKTTQAQLIQSEKMASLGELTAGIAHEIQNPLNFVNNFSEVNKELIEEASEAIRSGNTQDATELLSSIKSNEEKISGHGQRADAIVKGMLQHSRTSTGQKESTDINALADEYLRLSYHGIRAKDKSFNAGMQTDFDPAIGKLNVVPQDIGRVLLNLYNNAFYEVAEKKKQHPEGYEPFVSVTTKKAGDKVLISIKDNGNGIPQKVMDKIFQPFFTTKPTGQGTGLGLSLSYDIIKSHGGELKVGRTGAEGAEFVIQLPLN